MSKAKTVEQYWDEQEWSNERVLSLGDCPLESNVGRDCKELIDSTDYIIQSMECHGGCSRVEDTLIDEIINIMSIWYFG